MGHTQKFLGKYQLINRLTAQVGDRGMALNILADRGHVIRGTSKLTPAGNIRNAMTAKERALDRAKKKSEKNHIYNPYTNSTKLI